MIEEVRITADTHHTCVTHALIQESVENMGLLLGDVSGNVTTVWDVCLLHRSYKKKDRVEISENDLVFAAQKAEAISKQGRKTRVIGWFHSHPHISWLPSHVDLECQANYQMMDKGFVGLIFPVYNRVHYPNRNFVFSVEVYGFQSIENDRVDTSQIRSSRWKKKDLKTTIVYPPEMYDFPCNSFKRTIDISKILFEEERKKFDETQNIIGQKSDPLKSLMNVSTYQYNMAKLINNFLPLKGVINQQIKMKKEYLRTLEKKIEKLKKESKD